MKGIQQEYIAWLLAICTINKVTVDDILDPAALDLLASRRRTPLEIEQCLTLALETGYQASEMPIGEVIVESVLSMQIDCFFELSESKCLKPHDSPHFQMAPRVSAVNWLYILTPNQRGVKGLSI